MDNGVETPQGQKTQPINLPPDRKRLRKHDGLGKGVKRKLFAEDSSPLKKQIPACSDMETLSSPVKFGCKSRSASALDESFGKCKHETACDCSAIEELLCHESLLDSPMKLSNAHTMFSSDKWKLELEKIIASKQIFLDMSENVELVAYGETLCNLRIFEKISSPFLFDVQSEERSYSVVYVPHNKELCGQFCQPEKTMARVIGVGAYGKVFDIDKVAIKTANEDESVISAFIAGVIRAKSGADLLSHDCVINNLLISNSVCMDHKVSLSRTYDVDLYKFEDWDVRNVMNYYSVFCKLADAVRFLNLKCRINHFDISPMNIFINHKKEIIFDAVLADYSLSEIHPEYNGTCAIAKEYDRNLQLVPISRNKFCDMFNPGFRPLVANAMILVHVCEAFDGENNPLRHCNLDLCAFAQVVLLCVLRMTDKRGCREAQLYYEKRLFALANEACRLNPLRYPFAYRDACCKVLAEHVVLLGLLFYRDVVDIYEKIYDFLDERGEFGLRDLFEATFLNNSKLTRRQPIRGGLASLQSSEYGEKLLHDLRALFLITSSADLDKDTSSLFQM
uniref:Protein kinase n=1 Tax=Human herpesvirus 6B TaxID=32604 RepID=A8QXM8_HHV6H|nr:protein kinase [Human betaherpesvirus 6B]